MEQIELPGEEKNGIAPIPVAPIPPLTPGNLTFRVESAIQPGFTVTDLIIGKPGRAGCVRVTDQRRVV